MTTNKRLYLTSDRLKVVEHGDPSAAFLIAGVGDEIPAQFEALVSAPVVVAVETKKKK